MAGYEPVIRSDVLSAVPQGSIHPRHSARMAQVRSTGNATTELRLVALFRAFGIRGWRRQSALFGKPDFEFRRERVLLFVDGCFWHGCPRHATFPAIRSEWWAEKLARNKTHDRAVTRKLRASGWRVIRVWECALRPKRQLTTLRRIARALISARSRLSP